MGFIKTSKQVVRVVQYVLSRWKPFLLIVALLIGFALVLLGSFNLQGPALISTLIFGGLLIGIAIIGMAISSIAKRAVENAEANRLRDKLEQAEKTCADLEQKLKESRQNPLKMLHIEPILDLGILEADFELTKFYDQKYIKDKETGSLKRIQSEQKGKFRFIGGLVAKFTARYGIDLRTVKVKKDDATKRFYVSGANPEFSGTRGFPDIYWKGAVMLGKEWGAWATGDYVRWESDCKEEFRKDFQKNLQSGPEELNCFKAPLQEYVRRLIQGIFAPPGYVVELVNDDTAKDFSPLLEHLGKQEVRTLENGSGFDGPIQT